MSKVKPETIDEKGNDKEFTIIVNGQEKTVITKELSYAEVIALAYEDPPTGQYILFTVTYRRGHGNKPEGTLVDGEAIKVKEGMIFNVTVTDKS